MSGVSKVLEKRMQVLKGLWKFLQGLLLGFSCLRTAYEGTSSWVHGERPEVQAINWKQMVI